MDPCLLQTILVVQIQQSVQYVCVLCICALGQQNDPWPIYIWHALFTLTYLGQVRRSRSAHMMFIFRLRMHFTMWPIHFQLPDGSTKQAHKT